MCSDTNFLKGQMAQRVRAVSGSCRIATCLEIIFHPSMVSPDNSILLYLHIVDISFSISQASIWEVTATLSPIGVGHPAALRVRRWICWGWPRRVRNFCTTWSCGCSLEQQTGRRCITFWPWECGALRARPRVCVWGDSWAYWLPGSGGGREWDTTYLPPTPPSSFQAQTPDPYVSNWVKKMGTWDNATRKEGLSGNPNTARCWCT